MKRGDLVRIEYIRPGKETTYYEEDFYAQDETCLRTFKTLPEDISARLSESLVAQRLIQPGQRVGTISKVYFFTSHSTCWNSVPWTAHYWVTIRTLASLPSEFHRMKFR